MGGLDIPEQLVPIVNGLAVLIAAVLMAVGWYRPKVGAPQQDTSGRPSDLAVVGGAFADRHAMMLLCEEVGRLAKAIENQAEATRAMVESMEDRSRASERRAHADEIADLRNQIEALKRSPTRR